MTLTEKSRLTPSNSKLRVAAVSTAAILLIVLGGMLFRQRSENRLLQKRIHDARHRLEQHGAIELTDPRRLHVRWLPDRKSRQEEIACRIHVPAGKSYRLMLYAGPVPAKDLPNEKSGFLLPLELPSHDVDREVIAIGGLRFNFDRKSKRGAWQIFCRISDESGVKYPSINNFTKSLAPAYQKYFYMDQPVRTFESGVDRTKTCVFNVVEDHLLLAVARAYEPPLDAEGNVDHEKLRRPLEWVQTQKDKPATGFMYWIEKASGEVMDES